MRLWHYKLLPVLPDKFIIAEWRECIAIKRQWDKGTLKHRLVSYVMNYNRAYFLSYVLEVVKEMEKRKIKYNQKYLEEIKAFCGLETDLENKTFNYLTYPEHDERYLRQCYYNLQEKFDRDIINLADYNLINKTIGGKIDN